MRPTAGPGLIARMLFVGVDAVLVGTIFVDDTLCIQADRQPLDLGPMPRQAVLGPCAPSCRTVPVKSSPVRGVSPPTMKAWVVCQSLVHVRCRAADEQTPVSRHASQSADDTPSLRSFDEFSSRDSTSLRRILPMPWDQWPIAILPGLEVQSTGKTPNSQPMAYKATALRLDYATRRIVSVSYGRGRVRARDGIHPC
jgi:hypothetical protein